MSVATPKLVAWITKEARVVTEDGSLRELRLFFSAEGELRALLTTLPYDAEETDPESAAQELWDAAEHDASTHAEIVPRRYVVVGFRKDEPFGQFSFQVVPGSSASMLMLGDSSESPTERGVTAQLMRQNETLHRLHVVGNGDIINRLAAENHRLNESLERTQNRQLDMYELLETLNERKHERELERSREERKTAQYEKLMSVLLTLGPALLAQVFQNRAPMLEKATRDDALLGFLGSLDEEELQGAFAALKPEHQIGLAEIYKSARASVQHKEKGEPSNGEEKVDPC